MCVLANWLYLEVLFVAAWVAAAPACLAELAMSCASAYVSGTVTSHANGFPLDHGKMVVPSGRFPSWHLSIIIILVIKSPVTSLNSTF